MDFPCLLPTRMAQSASAPGMGLGAAAKGDQQMTVDELRIAIAELPDEMVVNVLLLDESEAPRPLEVDRVSIDRDGFLDVVAARE